MTPDGWPVGQKFGAIVADPPWLFKNRGKPNEKSALAHFNLMSLGDICDLPVANIAADDCALFLWAPGAHLRQAFRVMDAWGFTYKTSVFTWVKLTSKGNRCFGLGLWTRRNPEPCYLATRGSPKCKSGGVRELIESPRREYGRKPDEFYTRVEQLVPGPYLDLFSRQRRPGWHVWGDQIDRFEEIAA